MEIHLLPSSSLAPFMFKLVSISILTLLSSFAFGTNQIPRNESDRLALLDFKSALVDPLGALDSWNSTIHFCRWYGVTCGPRHHRVVGLTLESRMLRGAISPSIGNMSFLRVLDLQNNSLHSSIPPEVCRLSRLREFRLNDNALNGSVPPGLSLCSNLEIFNVNNNELEGNLPVGFSTLSKLRQLQVRANNLIGQIPISYRNLSSLRVLEADINRLDGMIPESLGSLPNLYFLSLGQNNLDGIIPPSILNVSTLEILDLSYNQLVGSLRPEMGFTLPAIRSLSVADNHIIGSIPKSLSNMSNLSTFCIKTNNFTGDLPSFQNMGNLFRVNMAYNNMGGRDVDDLDFLCSLTNSTGLDIFTDGLNLHSFAKAALPEHVYEVVDPFLMKEFHDDELGGSSYVRASRQNNKLRKIQGWLASIIRVGVVCSSEMPNDRMSAAEAVVALKVIQKELLQVITHANEDDITYISTS
ncbi:hypothetical protein SAY86_001838 [Trapa natans]|uniref:Leucine-rich repeat-containing N-terminal plant-type domain-containing protein n=1 Tax=Trapa natans TaxID=22666 RepID=A0AAN7QZ07_TRANT|nr:hypothetical protein SAY86_001838 [Trapa natans]